MILSKLLKKIKSEGEKQNMPDCYFTKEQMTQKGSFYKFIKKEVLDEGNPLIYEDKVYIATEEGVFNVMRGLDADRTYFAQISFNDPKLPDGKSGEYREDSSWAYLVNGYHIDDAFPVESEKFRLFLKEHLDPNDEYQVASVKTHLRRIGANETLDFLEKML